MSLTNFPNGVAVGSVEITSAGVEIGAVTVTDAGLVGGVQLPTQVISVAGPTAITLKSGLVLLTRSGGAAAATLAAPAAGDNGKILHILATTAQAHTVTIANGLSGAGAAADVGTFGGAVADRVSLVAYDGKWFPLLNTNVTFA